MSQAKPAAEGSLLAQLMEQANLSPADEAYPVARKGVEAFIAQMLARSPGEARADKAAVETMIAEIDRKLSRQLDAILHHESFQRLEASWRSLKMLVDRTDFRENIRIEMLSVSKADLHADFEDAPDITTSGLYKLAYTAEYGQFGGEPYGAIVGDYEFGPGPQDLALLQKVASVASMAHAPFLSAASPRFFGIDNFTKLPGLNDLGALFEGPQYAKWRSFRDSDDARSVGLTAPRFLLRLPYGPDTAPVKAFNYEEEVEGCHQSYLWGNTAFALASRLADSFAKYRWCPNIIGPQSGGSVENLPLHQYEWMGEVETKCPTEAMISERREFELAEEGFISLSMRKGSDNACFFSANSCQRPKTFGNSIEGKAAETNHRLGTQLPYLLVVNRLAHYLKVLQREQIGSWKDRATLQDELQRWLSQFVSDMESPSAAVRNTRPLRRAEITVEDVPGEAGWYRVGMKVIPHFKYMGASFTLSLVGKLDRA
jgi:type VI secretion system protein ImpC